MPDIIIIGAGIAGLTAALHLRENVKNPPSVTILEADAQPGGRIKTATHAGRHVNLGAHWFHGAENNTFWQWVHARYPDLQFTTDTVEHILHAPAEGTPDNAFREHGFAAFNAAWDAYAAKNPDTDISLANLQRILINTPESAAFAEFMAQCWMGADNAQQISCQEFFNDPHGPGGMQLKGGNQQIATRMAQDAMAAGVHIRYNTIMAHARKTTQGYVIHDDAGNTYQAARLLVSAPFEIIKRNIITFDPPLDDSVKRSMDGIATVHMTKLFMPLSPTFFTDHGIRPDTHIDITSAAPHTPSIYCQLYGNGTPGITMLLSGRQALQAETFTPAQRADFMQKTFARAPLLQHAFAYQAGDILATFWNNDPKSMGAYTATLPGHKRTGPLCAHDGTLIIMGEGASRVEHGGGGMSSAFESAREAVQIICPHPDMAAKQAPKQRTPTTKLVPRHIT